MSLPYLLNFVKFLSAPDAFLLFTYLPLLAVHLPSAKISRCPAQMMLAGSMHIDWTKIESSVGSVRGPRTNTCCGLGEEHYFAHGNRICYMKFKSFYVIIRPMGSEKSEIIGFHFGTLIMADTEVFNNHPSFYFSISG